MPAQFAAFGDFDDAPEIHDRDAVGDMLDHRKVVRDEQHREAEPRPQIKQQVDHLRLDRDVERGDRLVGDEQLGFRGERAGDADALALAAGEFVRVAVHRVRRQAHQAKQFGNPRSAIGTSLRISRWTISGSPIACAMVMRGLSEPNGSWKTSCMRRRCGFSARGARDG